jgi:hypothetical protein
VLAFDMTSLFGGGKAWNISPGDWGELCVFCLSLSSLRVLERPIKKNRAAASARIAAPATAIPAIAPVDRPCFESGAAVAAGKVAGVEVAEGVELDVEEGIVVEDARALGAPSSGKASPGWSMYDELPAIVFWFARETVAFCESQLAVHWSM